MGEPNKVILTNLDILRIENSLNYLLQEKGAPMVGKAVPKPDPNYLYTYSNNPDGTRTVEWRERGR